MAEHNIPPIDLVVVNLYPFAQTVARGAARDEIIENIDIGGPSMVRLAAKNHEYVAILTDPADFDAFIAELEASGGSTLLEMLRRLYARAFAAPAAYAASLTQWFGGADGRGGGKERGGQ